MRNEWTRPGMPGRWVVCALSVFGCIGVAGAQAQLKYDVLAGGWTGDGGQAKDASLHGVEDVVYDSAGNLYVSQVWANRIRKIAPNGTITTVVGGSVGFGGDGGPASQARIHHPSGLAIDGAGNLYFSDRENNRVRRIAPNGTISTFAGNGSASSFGDGGAAIAASINEPAGLSIDSAGNLYIAARSGNNIRKVTPGGTISTVAGNGNKGYSGDGAQAVSATLGWPEDVDVDAAGNLFIADTDNSVVRKVSGGVISTYAGSLLYPLSVKADGAGGVWISNTDCTLTYRTASGGPTYGSGACTMSPDGTLVDNASFGVPIGIAFDGAGNVVFADSDNARVAKITKSNMQISTLAGASATVPNGTAAAAAKLQVLNALSVDDAGAIALSDSLYAYRIRKLAGGTVTTIAGNGIAANACTGACSGPLDYGFGRVSGIASAGNGSAVYVADRIWNKVYRIAGNGTMTVFAGGGSGIADGAAANTLNIRARGIAMDAAGNLFVADAYNNRVFRITPAGISTSIAGGGSGGEGGPATDAYLGQPTHIAVDGAGNVYFYQSTGEIMKIGGDGILRRVAGAGTPPPQPPYQGEGGSALTATLGVVTSIAAHASGVYFVSDGAVRRITPNGRVETLKGLDHHAYGLAIKRNTLYIGAESGHVLRVVLPRWGLADYDGDQKSDLFWRDMGSGANAIWKAANSATQIGMPNVGLAARLSGQGDFDGDGKSDLVWRNTSNGANVIWRSASASTTIAVPTVTNQAWKIAGVGDFDGDGKSDLLWRNASTGQNSVYPSGQAAGAYNLATVSNLQWSIAGVGDFDADGRSDIVWRNSANGYDDLWLSGNANTRRPITHVTNLLWKIAGVGDFDGDGASDLLWRNATTGQNTIWRAALNTSQIAVTSVAGAKWTVASTGDYDGDGKADLLWRDTTTGANQVWKSANYATRSTLPAVGTRWQALP